MYIKILILFLLFYSNQVLSCACCTEGHEIKNYSSVFSDYEQNEWQELQFTGMFGINISDPVDTAIEIQPLKTNGKWQRKKLVLKLSRDNKTLGRITFKFLSTPRWHIRSLKYLSTQKITQSHVADQVYKELRIDGIFLDPENIAKKLGFTWGNKVTLYLHGIGNACFSKSQFHHWNLIFEMVKGKLKQKGRAEGLLLPLSKKNLIQAKKENRLGMRAYRQKHYKVAIQHFLQAINADPTFLLGYTNVAAVYALTNKKTKSIDQLILALQLDEIKTRRKMRIDPDYDLIRASSEFQRLLNK